MTQQISLPEAVTLVNSSSTIALGGMTVYRRPVAFVLELLRRETRPDNLTLLNFTAAYESDLLVGAGCVSTIRSVYFGLDTFGLAPMFTQAASTGQITIVEETEASLVAGLQAKMIGVNFLPSQAWIGTDLPSLRPDVKTINDPYSDETLMAFPAIDIDVVVLHALEADKTGNVKFNNNICIDMELVYVADTVIVTCEKLVDQVQRSADGIILPAPGTDYIVHAENGAWPSSCHPAYPMDGGEFMRYVDACNTGNFEQYLEKLL